MGAKSFLDGEYKLKEERFMCEVSGEELKSLIRKNQIVLTKKQKVYLKLKRVLDFICAFIALIVLFPIILFISIAIKLESPHEKIIFKQKRIGMNGEPFTFYKFRSMKMDAPELGTSEFVDAEQYITKVGKFIRKTSLDELPQLWSVLCGEMSLVGARPLIVREDEIHFLRNYYGIYQLRPGITGLAQINGRDVMGVYEKVRWDRAYVHNVSFLLDVKILWKTVRQVLKSEGIIDTSTQKKDLMSSKVFERTNQVYDDRVQQESIVR